MCTAQRQVGSWMYNKYKNLWSCKNNIYFFQYIISNFHNITKILQVFVSILQLKLASGVHFLLHLLTPITTILHCSKKKGYQNVTLSIKTHCTYQSGKDTLTQTLYEIWCSHSIKYFNSHQICITLHNPLITLGVAW